MQASRGWVQRDDTFMDAFQNQKYVNQFEKGVIIDQLSKGSYELCQVYCA